MRLDKTWAIAKRELLARVRTKGFWISTVILPLFLGGLMVGPSLLATKSRSELKLAVVDATGDGLGAQLVKNLAGVQKGRGNEGIVRFEVHEVAPAGDPAAQRAQLDEQVRTEEIDGWLWLDRADLVRNSFVYHAENVSSPVILGLLENKVSDLVRDWRLKNAGYDSARIRDLTASLDADTMRVTAEGSRKEKGLLGLIVPFSLFFLLYMVFLIYGSQILQGVLEEKSSRIIEVLASSVKTTELMLGKIAGIGLTALIQMAIWLATLAAFTVPGLLGALVMGDTAASLPELSPWVFVHFLLLFLAGFLMCASLYASIGASFNNLEEAQQFAVIPMVVIIAPLFFLMPVLNDPNSTLSVVTSLIPFFTPMLMALRIAIQMPPLWQILLGYLLCGATVALLVWVCARIYRVGILMYGKKPTVQEIWRWVRYA
jgi:ABC-2 type transport system permease protein